jgi:hypothetical protein
MFPIKKVHKDSLRMVMSCASVHNKQLSLLVLACMKVFGIEMDAFAVQLAAKFNAATGSDIQLVTVVNDGPQAAINMPKLVIPAYMVTLDVAKCYDVIPIDRDHKHGLYQRLRKVMSIMRTFLARTHGPEVGFAFRKCADGFKAYMVDKERKKQGYKFIRLEVLAELLQILLDHCYVQIGGVLYRKSRGFPQGLHPGPELINRNFMGYDFEFVLKGFYDTSTRFDIKMFYSCQKRFIDDFKILRCERAEQIMNVVFPNDVYKYEVTSRRIEKGIVGSFLQLGLTLDYNGKLSFHAVFKADQLTFTPVQYVQLLSNRPTTACYNLIVGQVKNSVLLNSTAAMFRMHLHRLFDIFQENGFELLRLGKKVLSYVHDEELMSLTDYDVVRAIHKLLQQRKRLRT